MALRAVAAAAVLVSALVPGWRADRPGASVPVVVCPTTVGAETAPVPVPATAGVPGPAAHMALYAAVSADLEVLGPGGYFCQATVGADGNTTVTAWPSSNMTGALGAGGVRAVSYPACTGCQLALACRFFAGAARRLEVDGLAHCAAPPRGEMVKRLNAYSVQFTDPPGGHPSAGALVPPAGTYPTEGVVVYGSSLYRGQRDPVVEGATCVLPAAQRAACAEVLHTFTVLLGRRYPGLSPA